MNVDLVIVSVGVIGAAFLLLANDAETQGHRRDELAWSVMGGLLLAAALVLGTLSALVR